MVPNEPVLELHGLNLALWQLEPVLKHPFSLGSKANRCKYRLEQKTKALFSTSASGRRRLFCDNILIAFAPK
jgi:hypothetical protein